MQKMNENKENLENSEQESDKQLANNNGCLYYDLHHGFALKGTSELENIDPNINLALVRFKANRYNFYCVQPGIEIKIDDYVIVEAERGIDLGQVAATGELAFIKLQVRKSACGELKKIIRLATQEEIEKLKENRQKEDIAYNLALEKIAKHNLPMKLVDVEYQLDVSRITFYYTADHRIDFRELVKDLAHVYHTRIEMRQIGVRDETKRIGGIGVCGRELCCTTWLNNFEKVSAQHIVLQGLANNPLKLAGQCSRLKCCLTFEINNYLNSEIKDTDFNVEKTV